MGALGNPDHERFCQAAHKLIWEGKTKHVAAYEAAYIETIWSGEGEPDRKAISANVRKLRNRKDVGARLAELREFSGRLAGCNAAWALVTMKQVVAGIVAFNLDDFLSPPDDKGERYFDISRVSRDKLEFVAGLDIDQWEKSFGDGTPVIRGLRVKVKPPSKESVSALIGQMAKIAGWEAPQERILTVNPIRSLLDEIDGTTRGLPQAALSAPERV